MLSPELGANLAGRETRAPEVSFQNFLIIYPWIFLQVVKKKKINKQIISLHLEKSIDVVDGLDEENIEGESTSGISTINSNKSLRLQNVSLVNNNDNENKSMK